jgi:DNA-binding transcriptional LysR family regulator
MVMNISVRQLKAFLLVAQHRSFSRAAEQMFMTQSGLSVLIRELERQIQFRLFDRTTRSVDGVRKLEAGISEIGQAELQGHLSLSVGAPPMTAANILPKVIAHFQNVRRNLHVRLYDVDLPRISEMVKSGEIDIGLGMFIKPTPGLRRTSLFRFSLMVVRAKEVGSRRQRALRWTDLSGQTLIGLPPDNPIQQLVAKHLLKVGLRAPPHIVVNYLDTMVALAAAGAGVAIVPSSVLPACRHRGAAMELLTEPVVDLDLYEIRSRGRVLHSGVEEFTAFLKKHIASWAHQREGL